MLYTKLCCNFAACSVFFISIAMVIGPTPPGTGVMYPAFGSTESKSTSPQSFPSSMRLMPTSMTIAPSFTMSAVTNFGLPMATTRISALAASYFRFFVREWQMVTVPFFCSSSIAIGFPTMLLLPMTTHCLPLMSTPVLAISSMIPAGVHGRKS